MWTLLSAKTEESHSHRSLIINLACGATIMNAASRDSLYEGYVRQHLSSVHYIQTSA